MVEIHIMNYNIIPLKENYTLSVIMIGCRVWIEENAVVLSGVKIGDCRIIGANSAVIKDAPACSVVAGNQA